MNPLATLSIVAFSAFLSEAAVEAVFGKPMDHIEKLTPYKWLLAYVAFAVGIALAFVYKFDLIYTISVWFDSPLPITPLGIVLTGLGIGRGSNFINDLASRWLKK